MVFRRPQPSESFPMDTAPTAAPELAQVRSAPLDEIVAHVLDVSDNEAAEVLAHHVGLAVAGEGSFVAGAEAVTRTLADLGVPTRGLELHDGSGLSRAFTKPSERNVDVPGWASLGDLVAHYRGQNAPVSFVGLVDAATNELAGDHWHDPAHEHGVYGGDGRGPIAAGELRDGYHWDFARTFEKKRSWVETSRTPLTWPVFTSPRRLAEALGDAEHAKQRAVKGERAPEVLHADEHMRDHAGLRLDAPRRRPPSMPCDARGRVRRNVVRGFRCRRVRRAAAAPSARAAGPDPAPGCVAAA